MADEFIVSSVKAAVHLARQGQHDASFQAYQALFQAPEFAAATLANKRQALRLMVTAKGIPEPLSPAATAAFRTAQQTITVMVNGAPEPQDYDLLGLTLLKLGDTAGAKQLFDAGYALALARNDAEWTGQLLKRISLL